MMKKVLSYILIVLGLVVLYISTSRACMDWISQKKNNSKWWGDYHNNNGDLVNMSYLDFVSKFVSPKDFSAAPVAESGYHNTELFIHGDSYTMDIPDSAFATLGNYHYINRKNGLNYHLDTSRNNILIIEVTERYTRFHFDSLRIFNELCDSEVKKKQPREKFIIPAAATHVPEFLTGSGIDDLFNKNINQNLEYNLFNYTFISSLFKSKAALNYYLFNRASGNVIISRDGDFLFFREAAEPTGIFSSYSPVDSSEIAHLVNNFNRVYDHYKATGFEEVYLSIIPSPPTIMQPEGYNRLIPLIQDDKRLRMKIIDAYSLFKQTKDLCYRPGDTHWNNTGLRKWLAVVNDTLIQTARRKGH